MVGSLYPTSLIRRHHCHHSYMLLRFCYWCNTFSILFTACSSFLFHRRYHDGVIISSGGWSSIHPLQFTTNVENQQRFGRIAKVYEATTTPATTAVTAAAAAARKPTTTTRLGSSGKWSLDDTESSSSSVDPRILQRHKCWVILVDDEESIRLSVGDFLYDQGYEVTACDGAASLLEVLDGGPMKQLEINDNKHIINNPQQVLGRLLPDVIVSDVRMPDTDGIELLSILRSDPRYQRIPVVLLTAKAMTIDRIAGYKAGADAYLPKPFHPDELLSILDNTILRRQQMKNSQSQLANLKQEMATIKNIMKQNSANTVKQTNVYLTPTERAVLELVCQGLTNKEIAQERSVSTDRVIKIVQKLFTETNTRKRTELVRWAFQTGYVSPRQ